MNKTPDVDLEIVRKTYAKYFVGRTSTEAFQLTKHVLSRIFILHWDDFIIDSETNQIFRLSSGNLWAKRSRLMETAYQANSEDGTAFRKTY